MIQKVFISAILFCLAGCQSPNIEPFSLDSLQTDYPVKLAVEAVQVIDKTTHYTELPHLETRMPITPTSALSQAFTNHFIANRPETASEVTFVIHEADMVQKTQESDSLFVLNNTEYTLTYQVDVIYTHNGTPLETQHLSGWEKQALPKRGSLAEKERAWQKMLNGMVQKTVEKITTDIPDGLRME